MPAMSAVEQAFCRSAPWRVFTQRLVLPWALDGRELDGDVLEIGGGGGAMAEQLLGRFQGTQLMVTDHDEAMVAPARPRLRRFGERVRVEPADATALPYADGTFDGVVSFIMLHHVLEWEKALAEAVRVLRPGGVLVGYDLLSTGVSRWIHRVDGSRNRLMQLHELREQLRGVKLDDVRCQPGLRGLVVRFSGCRPSR